MAGFWKAVVASHVIYQGDVFDIDNFVTQIGVGAGSGSAIVLPQNTTSVPSAADTVFDFATTGNGATGVISRPAHIPAEAINGIIRIRGSISNASGLGSSARIILTGEPSISSWSDLWHMLHAIAGDSINSMDRIAYVQIGGSGGGYPGINYTFQKTGTPQGFFTVQWIGWTK
jgi:hypothetical protein